jgi:hypothetical protein
MFMFSFGVSLVPLHFDTVLPSSYSLLKISKAYLKISSKKFTFSKDSLKASL